MNRSHGATLRVTASTAPSASTLSSPDTDRLVEYLIEFLKGDLEHLFDDQGIDTTKYDPNVVFEDPITKYGDLQGYLTNISFLRRVFDPSFKLLDIRRTGPLEITTRWSMVMTPTFVRPVPFLQSVWNPVLTFTGTSVMTIDAATGRFNRHSDTWDAIQNQRYFSVEAFTHMLSQVFDLRRTPMDLETPPYTVLKKTAKYEVREYPAFTVAQLPYRPGAAPSTAGFTAFGALAGYIFGRNGAGKKMDMTTPVFSTNDKMQFYLGSGLQPEAAPAPLDSRLQVARAPGGVFAVASFSGLGGEGDAEDQVWQLRKHLMADGVEVQLGGQWVLARYNDPGTPPPFRRNEVMLPLADFKLW